MSVKVAKSRFIVSSLIQGVESYQHVINSVSSFQELGVRLVQEIETARVFRRVQKIEDLSLILSNLPIREYQLISQYYYALSSFLKGDNTQHTFETVLDESRTYKARALITLAGIEARKGNTEAELKYFAKAVKYAHSPSLLIEIYRGAAIVKAKEGCQGQAIKELEKIYPLIQHTDFYTQCQYFNSLAVELCDIGRITEATNISRITLASPFINAYPEWRETWQELALRGYKSRSSVPVIQSFLEPKKAKNVLRLPERERPESTRGRPFFQPSEVTSLKDWKNKMVKEPNGGNGDEKNLDEMNDKDLFMELMRVASDDSITSRKLRKMVDAIKKIATEKD